MGIAEKKEVLLIIVALVLLLVIGNYLSPTGQASKNYYCYDTDGRSTLTQGTVTYSNLGVAEKAVTDFCLEEGKAGSLVHEYWCAEQTMKESNFACSYDQKCLKGKCVAMSAREVGGYNY